jgi:hypothetical protein
MLFIITLATIFFISIAVLVYFVYKSPSNGPKQDKTDCGSLKCGLNQFGYDCGTCKEDEICNEGNCIKNSCYNKQCSPDGICGVCKDTETCEEGTCKDICENVECSEDGPCKKCPVGQTCVNSKCVGVCENAGRVCGTFDSIDCGVCLENETCDMHGHCVPKQCQDTFCKADYECNNCDPSKIGSFVCDTNGSFGEANKCIKRCKAEGKVCGKDSMNFACSDCGNLDTCVNGQCMNTCKLNGWECDDPGDPALCSQCPSNKKCVNRKCVDKCTGEKCSDVCPCPNGQVCNGDGTCSLKPPSCSNKCGKYFDLDCGLCQTPGTTCVNNECVPCDDNCEQLQCGKNGCGRVCNPTLPGFTCINGRQILPDVCNPSDDTPSNVKIALKGFRQVPYESTSDTKSVCQSCQGCFLSDPVLGGNTTLPKQATLQCLSCLNNKNVKTTWSYGDTLVVDNTGNIKNPHPCSEVGHEDCVCASDQDCAVLTGDPQSFYCDTTQAWCLPKA